MHFQVLFIIENDLSILMTKMRSAIMKGNSLQNLIIMYFIKINILRQAISELGRRHRFTRLYIHSKASPHSRLNKEFFL